MSEKLECKACGLWVVPVGPERTCPNCTAPIPVPPPPVVSSIGAPGVGPDGGPLDPASLIPCRFCGQQIPIKARKCRHCGEFQSDADRALQNKAPAVSSEADDNLTGAEIALGILCSGIACILAIVWMIQGKKKGAKLLLISIIAQVVIGVLRVLAGR